MKGILLMSHGGLAKGMKDTLELFSGEVEQLDSLELAPGQNIHEFRQQFKNKIDVLDLGQGVVVFCDLAFGTPSNIAGQLLKTEQYKESVQVITGMNLPMILEYTQLRDSEFVSSEVIQIGKEGILNFNEELKNR